MESKCPLPFIDLQPDTCRSELSGFGNIVHDDKIRQVILTSYLFDRHTDDVRLFVDSCLNKNLKLRAECKGLLVQEFVTKWEVLTPNYLTRWLNRTTKKKAAVSTDPNVSVEEGNSSPFRGPESPTSK